MSLLLLFRSSGGGPTARNVTISATEGFTDSASINVAALVGAQISATDAKDTAVLRVGPIVGARIQATDSVDTAVLRLAAIAGARIVAIDATDTILLRAAALVAAQLQATEAQDIAVLRVDTGAGGSGQAPLVGMMANMGTLLNRR